MKGPLASVRTAGTMLLLAQTNLQTQASSPHIHNPGDFGLRGSEHPQAYANTSVGVESGCIAEWQVGVVLVGI